MDAALSIKNLRVDYGRHTAVHDLSLRLAPGEIFGLAGPNGAGKTSTIRALATLLEPTHGEIRIAGFDIFEAPEKVHALLGYMPDMAPAIPDLKVWEFLDLYAHSHGFQGSQRRDRVDACLGKVKLAESRDVYCRELSRGMTQRVVLAKTLLHEPRVLLLDEPASGMDPLSRRDLREILQEVAAAGATVLISSHILSELSDMCTSFGIMHLGRLLQHGPMDMLLEEMRAGLGQLELVFAGERQAAIAYLRKADGVETLDVAGNKVSITYVGDARTKSRLLKGLLDLGCDIRSFSSGRSDIETLLMRLIDGESP